MKYNVKGAALRLMAFVLVTALAMFALLAIFAQFRFDSGQDFKAHFTDVTGLQNGNFVRIAGVEVGKVKDIVLQDDGTVLVVFSADNSVVLTEGSRAVIRWDNVIGGRYLALEEGAGGTRKLRAGATIPLDRTAPALDLDSLIGGFRPLFRALDPGQVNALTGQLISAFQGQGDTIGSFLTQTASLTSALADRDVLIGQVIGNLNTVLGSLGGRSDQFAKAVDSLSELVHGLEARKKDIATGLAYVNAGTASVADLLQQARPPLRKTVTQVDRASTIVLSDHDYVDDLLKTLPDPFKALGRQALNGDYFSFYFCDIVLKLNGKGGQPVYVKVAGQSSGRCTPK
ncbi:MCE family protein [Mycobacterium sp. 050134]|uniref:MCE family protein n=1 Tax=Mycobacterium sp. 050134 TaxID=3096111 RepID=UPI002ED88DA7